MLRLVTAREQGELLYRWHLAALSGAEARQKMIDYRKRNRLNRLYPDRYPALTPDELAEHQQLDDWREDLKNRWDNMEPMTDEEIENHRQMNGQYVGGQMVLQEPEKMSQGDQVDYYARLSDNPERTPRQQHHFDQMKPMAEEHLNGLQLVSQLQLKRHADYLAAGGHHPDGTRSIAGQQGTHDLKKTGHWASELSQADDTYEHPHLIQRSKEYLDALQRVADEGPLGTAPMSGQHHYKALEQAHNNLHVELQHKGKFKVPAVSELSRVPADWQAHADGGVINPRLDIGMDMPPSKSKSLTQSHRDAYKVNCQRCVLAAEMRHRGYNVEAQRNIQTARGGPSDHGPTDHDIASWFKDKDGNSARWIDSQDTWAGINTPKSPKQWDAMHEDIKSWGPGARGLVAFSYSTPGGVSRHVISAKVGDDGEVTYSDPQSGESQTGTSFWRKRIGYRLHGKHATQRYDARSNLPPDKATKAHNTYYSPLRYLRTDDKDLADLSSWHVVDRGSAPDRPIVPPGHQPRNSGVNLSLLGT